MNELMPKLPEDDAVVERLLKEIAESTDSPRARAFKKFAMAAIGAIPWVGGFIAATVELRENPDKINQLHRQWLEHHGAKLQRLQGTLASMASRLESFGDEINQRLESPAFLGLVDKGFRQWDEASTEEKRDYVRRLLTNCAASSLCTDDLVRLFLDWIRKYDETHFRVIEAIFNNPGSTRLDIWLTMHPTLPRDNSSEADLFKLLIDDLSLGHVIRQHRNTTEDGKFLKHPKPARARRPNSITMKSPFDDSKEYELTELGSKFVHYVMNEVAPQLGASP